VYVVVGIGVIFSSPDAVNWTEHYRDTVITPNLLLHSLNSITFGNGKFVAVGYISEVYQMSKALIMSSTDGRSWTTEMADSVKDLYSVMYVNNQFVAVGDQIATSSDGISWKKQMPYPSCWLEAVAYGNGQLVAVGMNGTILTSSDGVSWMKQNFGGKSFLSVTYADNQFVAVGNGEAIIALKTGNSGIAFPTRRKKLRENEVKIIRVNNTISALVPFSISHSQLSVRLFAVNGKSMYSTMTHANNGIIAIPVSGFPAGRYFITIADEKGAQGSSPFVVTR
jgi:hypothetical protein